MNDKTEINQSSRASGENNKNNNKSKPAKKKNGEGGEGSEAAVPQARGGGTDRGKGKASEANDDIVEDGQMEGHDNVPPSVPPKPRPKPRPARRSRAPKNTGEIAAPAEAITGDKGGAVSSTEQTPHTQNVEHVLDESGPSTSSARQPKSSSAKDKSRGAKRKTTASSDISSSRRSKRLKKVDNADVAAEAASTIAAAEEREGAAHRGSDMSDFSDGSWM